MTTSIVISGPTQLMRDFEAHAAKLNKGGNKDQRINITGVEYSNGEGNMTMQATSKLFAHETVLDKLYEQGYDILSY